MKVMKCILSLLIFSLFLTSCASYRTKPMIPKTVSTPKKVTQSEPATRPAPAVKGYFAIWELLNSTQVTLQLTNVDDGSNLSITIDKGLSKRKVSPGHWELTGFEENGTSFVSMNISKKFVFRMREKSHVYAGSIVIGCPKIATKNFKLLRNVKYFNRYAFSSTVGLCELVVADDFMKVKSKVMTPVISKSRKSQKSKKLNLVNGL